MAEFDGPLALLLSLIEARQLDVLTVPLGGLADAYLDALARLEADRLGNVSSFVAVASQLILIKSRAMLPRRPSRPTRRRCPTKAPIPRPSCAPACSSIAPIATPACAWPTRPMLRIGLFRREPGAAHAAALAGARPADAPPLDPAAARPRARSPRPIAPPPEPPPEVMARTITLTERAAIIRAALRDAPTVVLQDLLAGVRDRVVIAITFLAMLELMKRREIVVEQAEPWGPIVARRTTAEERAAAGVAEVARRCAARRVAGVVRMTDEPASEPDVTPSRRGAPAPRRSPTPPRRPTARRRSS